MLTVAPPAVLAPPATRARHVRTVYERAAGRYDRVYRRLWIAAAGRRAERAMLNKVVAALAPLANPRVLDAGAGTGALTRELAELLPAVHPVLVDVSPAMLARAADLGDPRAVASVTALPFPDATFDVIVCAWVIETVDDPHAVVSELLRVLRPGGRLVYSFCSRPSARRDRWRTGPLRAIVHGVFAGRFLTDAQTPFHDCGMSSRTSYAGGVVTVVSLGTCCTVADAHLPCRAAVQQPAPAPPASERATVAPLLGQARRHAAGPAREPAPLRWWAPAAVFAVFAVVLSVLVIAVGTNKGPLDDPNQAYQRDGSVHTGPVLPARLGGVVFGGTTVVVLFVRRQPAGPVFARWSADVARGGRRLVVAVAGQPETPALRGAVGMRTPNDGGQPVGYAIVDPSGRVRYATLDPAYLDHASEVRLLTAALPRHAP